MSFVVTTRTFRHFCAARPAMLVLGFAAVTTILAGCNGRGSVGDPVEVGLDVDEPELAGFLKGLIHEARTDAGSGLRRGQLGMGYLANGFYGAAERTFAQAAKLDPEIFRWPYLRAISLAGSSRHDEAVAAIDRAIEIDAGNPSAWLWRGAWLLDLDRYQEAGESYDKALELARDPMVKVAAEVGVARTEMRRDQILEAVGRLERVAGQLGHPHVMRLLKNGYRRLGRTDDAAAIKLPSDTPPLAWPDELQRPMAGYVRGFSGRMLAADKLLAEERAAEALKILEPLRAEAPADRALLNNLSIAYDLVGRRDDAIEVLRRGLQIDPDYHLFHFNIAVHYEDMGDEALALRHLDRALALDVSLDAAHQRKIGLLIRLDRVEEALAALDEAERYQAASAESLFYGGMMAGAAAKWPLAIERLSEAVRLDPAFGRAFLFLGRSLAEAERYVEAQEAYRRAADLGVPADDIAAARARMQELQRNR